MTGTENTRWVAVSALGAAMFAIGFSVTGVACSSRDVSVTDAARAAASASALPASASSLATVATIVNGAAPSVPSVSSVPSVRSGASAAPNAGSQGASDAGLKLKRFVVAHKIEHREPVLGADFTVGSAPVYAFVELENDGSAARDIRVMFQNEDTQATVGHVKLSVPGSQARFRTWGNTRLIRDPGHWVAVVSTTDGVELGRAAFDVKS